MLGVCTYIHKNLIKQNLQTSLSPYMQNHHTPQLTKLPTQLCTATPMHPAVVCDWSQISYAPLHSYQLLECDSISNFNTSHFLSIPLHTCKNSDSIVRAELQPRTYLMHKKQWSRCERWPAGTRSVPSDGGSCGVRCPAGKSTTTYRTLSEAGSSSSTAPRKVTNSNSSGCMHYC